MSCFARLVTLIAFAICFLAPACTRPETPISQSVPEWLRSYPGVEPQIKSAIENSPGPNITLAFGTDDPPESVADFYTQKLSAAGLNPVTETSRDSNLNEIRINSTSQSSQASILSGINYLEDI